MITLDTSAIVGLSNPATRDHKALREALTNDRGPFLVPATIFAEITYMLDARSGQRAVIAFLNDLEGGAFLTSPEHDVPRIIELIERYTDPPLGYADAAVVSCAEANGGRVLTLDWRHFGPVAREGRIEVLPV